MTTTTTTTITANILQLHFRCIIHYMEYFQQTIIQLWADKGIPFILILAAFTVNDLLISALPCSGLAVLWERDNWESLRLVEELCCGNWQAGGSSSSYFLAWMSSILHNVIIKVCYYHSTSLQIRSKPDFVRLFQRPMLQL